MNMFGLFTKKKVDTTHDGGFTLPRTYAAISLGQYVAWHEANDAASKCAAALNATLSDVRKLNPDSIARINAAFQTVIETETTAHIKACKLNGREYGFIPAIDEAELGVYIDLDNLMGLVKKGDNSKLIDMMCVCYRPITSRMGNAYTIADYTAKEVNTNRKDIEQLPMSIVSGAMFFFSNFEVELLTSSAEYLTNLQRELEMDLQST